MAGRGEYGLAGRGVFNTLLLSKISNMEACGLHPPHRGGQSPFFMELLGAATPSSLPIGYLEHPLACTHGETAVHLWLPLKEQPATMLQAYRIRTHSCKKVRVISSTVGMQCPILPCTPMVDTTIPPASQDIGAASASDQVASAPSLRGLVVLAHGLADGPLVLAHLCERLARHGFVVAAPSHADSANNSSDVVLPYGRQFIAEQTVVRMHVTENCIRQVRRMYPPLEALPLALIGYSAGCDTLRQLAHLDCARVYIAGPGWLGAIAGSSRSLPATPPPLGRSLQLLPWPDAAMKRFGIEKDDASAYTGYSCPDARTLVPAERVGDCATFVRGEHFRVDFEPLDHSSLKYVPFREAEYGAYAAAFCGINPWFPCGRAAKSDEVVQQIELARMRSVDAIVNFVMAGVGDNTDNR